MCAGRFVLVEIAIEHGDRCDDTHRKRCAACNGRRCKARPVPDSIQQHYTTPVGGLPSVANPCPGHPFARLSCLARERVTSS